METSLICLSCAPEEVMRSEKEEDGSKLLQPQVDSFPMEALENPRHRLTGIVKRVVALGRYFQNPLAALCGPEKEILSWNLCPLDDFLTPDEKYDMVEHIMVDATNQVGVNVNLASKHEWLFAPLQFVASLGPRKASALQRAFIRAGSVFNRKGVSMDRILKKKVFKNTVGFLRIHRNGAAAGTKFQ